MPAYIAIYSVIFNFAVAVILTLVFNLSARSRADETLPGDYATEGSAGRH